MKKSDSINELAAAWAKAQGEMKNPPLDGMNPHFRSKFATLAGVRDTVLPVLARHGLSVIQSAGSGERGPVLTTLLLHSSGQWVETDPLELPASKQDAQGYGSAITYARRYALLALAGVTGDDDDDGNAAVAQPKQPAKKAAPPKEAAAKRPDDPEDGDAFLNRLIEAEEWAIGEGLCERDGVKPVVQKQCREHGLSGNYGEWNAESVKTGMNLLRVHLAALRAKKPKQPAA